MTSPTELRAICDALQKPPFARTFSVIALHDDLAHPELVALISDVVAVIDATKAHDVDIRHEFPEATAARLAAFLANTVNFTYNALDESTIALHLLKGDDRALLLNALHFLLQDIDARKKDVYLSRYLNLLPVPLEYANEESVHALLEQYRAYQEEFKTLHDQALQLKLSSAEINDMKREIQQMEEEKQMLSNKIQRTKIRVQDMPQRDKWLEVARNLRLEQQKQHELTDRLKEQKNLSSQAEQKVYTLQQKLKDAKESSNSTPQALLQRLREETQANTYLSEEKLAKDIHECEQKLANLQRAFTGPMTSQQDLVKYEDRLQQLNASIKVLTEKRMSRTIDDKFVLFKQQASIITNKKDSAASKLSNVMARNNELQAEIVKKSEAAKAMTSSKIPKGDDFKNYVAQLRNKSSLYKAKKAELSELIAEQTIVSRTVEILQLKEKQASEALEKVERKSGVSGFSTAQETLEKVSEKKSELDEAKEITMIEVSAIVQQIVQTINEKKTVLAPSIQELRNLRQKHSEVETVHNQKKAAYNAVMFSLDAETRKLETDLKVVQNEYATDQSRWHYVHIMCELADISMDRVLQEMKAYIGGDPELEAIQRQRGFKTYRDIYTKKINEQESLTRNLREQQKEVKEYHEHNLQQQAMFSSLKRLLTAKVECNKKTASLTAGGAIDDMFSTQGQDRLVIS